jgi:hypothetical protein
MSAWLFDGLKRVLRAAARRENWDGQGSPAPSSAVVEKSVELLRVIDDDEPPLPRVVPVPGGGLQLEWHEGSRELELEVLPDGSVEYLAVVSGVMREGRLPATNMQSVRSLVRSTLAPE